MPPENREYYDYEWRAEWDAHSKDIFGLLELFFQKNPIFLWDYKVEEYCSALEKLSTSKLSSLDEKELKIIDHLFNPAFRNFYLLLVQENDIIGRTLPYFMQMWNLSTKIPSELFRRYLKDCITQPTQKSLLSYLISPLSLLRDQLKNKLKDSGFTIKGSYTFKGKPLFLVKSTWEQYYFVEPSWKDSTFKIKKSFDGFKGYSFNNNKLYQFLKKQDWKIDEIKLSAEKYLKKYPEAKLLDFFLSFMPENIIQRLKEFNLAEANLSEHLSTLGIIITQLNIEGYQQESFQLLAENSEHEISQLWTRKTRISKPQKTEKEYHGKTAISFEVEDFDGSKGIIVTNGSTSDFFPYE